MVRRRSAMALQDKIEDGNKKVMMICADVMI